MANHLSLGFFLLALVTLSVCVRQPYKVYPASYDDTDVNGILNNRNLRNAYVACLMDRGPCSPEGQTLKDILPMAVDDNCGRCTAKQDHLATKVKNHFLRSKNPADIKIWEDIEAKYHIDRNKIG